MGTRGDFFTENQQMLKTLIQELGWSNNDFARRWIWEKEETDDEAAIKKFEEKFKKQLARTTTKENLIKAYLDFLYQQPEAKHLGFVRPVGENYQDSLSHRFYKFSRSLTDRIRANKNKCN